MALTRLSRRRRWFRIRNRNYSPGVQHVHSWDKRAAGQYRTCRRTCCLQVLRRCNLDTARGPHLLANFGEYRSIFDPDGRLQRPFQQSPSNWGWATRNPLQQILPSAGFVGKGGNRAGCCCSCYPVVDVHCAGGKATNHIGVLSDATNPFAPTILKSIEEQASKMGLRVHPALVQNEDEVEDAPSSMKQAGIAVFISVVTPFLFNRRVRLVKLVLEHRLARVFTARELVEAGALMSYGAKPAGLVPSGRRLR
jgi:hypothetical protein